MEGVIFSTHPPCLPEPVKLDKLDILCMAIRENSASWIDEDGQRKRKQERRGRRKAGKIQ